MVNTNCIVCTNSRGTVSHSSFREFYISIGNCLLLRFTDARQSPAFQRGISKDGILRTTVFTRSAQLNIIETTQDKIINKIYIISALLGLYSRVGEG